MKIISALVGTLFLTVILSFSFPGDWVLLEKSDFKILFPQKPEEQTQTVNTALGKLNIDTYIYEVPDSKKDDNLMYMFAQTAYPDTAINSDKKDLLDKFFRGSIDGAVNNVHGKLLSETVIQLNGYPGRKVRIDFKDGLAVINMGFYLVKNKLYMSETITETKNDFNKSIDKFFNSFSLK